MGSRFLIDGRSGEGLAVGHRYRLLVGLCVAQLFLMLVYLNYAAVLPELRRLWGMTNTQAGTIFSAYQAGYICSVVALASLTDRYNARWIFLLSAAWSALAAGLFGWLARGYLSALALRTLAGIGLGGTYMPGLRLVAERFEPAERGRAVGLYVGSIIAGMGLSLLVTGQASSLFGWRGAFLVSGAGGAVGLVLASVALRGVQRLPAAPGRGLRREVLENRSALYVIAGYAAHVWELFGMRGWMPAFIAANLVAHGVSESGAEHMGAVWASAVIGVGALSCAACGWLSDRIGRLATIRLMLAASVLGSLTFGWLVKAPFWMVMLVGLLYGAVVVGESPAYSTSLTEVVAPASLGAAMAAQSLVGWFAGLISPAVFGWVLDVTNPAVRPGAPVQNWGWAFVNLGVVAAVGLVAVGRLSRLQLMPPAPSEPALPETAP